MDADKQRTHETVRPDPKIPSVPGIGPDSKQYRDMVHRANFDGKIKIYNQLDKKILIKLLVDMEEQYRKLSEQRNSELMEFAEKISELQMKLDKKE